MDARIKNHARLLVRYCLDVKKGQTILVRGNSIAEPLFHAVYEELLKVGAYPALQMAPDGLVPTFFEHAHPHHLSKVPDYLMGLANAADGTINIGSETNTRSLSHVEPDQQATYARNMSALRKVLIKKPWTITLFPTQAYAQDAEMPLSAFEDYVYGAMFADEEDPVAAWKELKKQQDTLIKKLKGADQIRILSDNTDLTLSVKGRTFINSDGRRNMPSGEIFTGPIENSANGHIQYDFPVCVHGREVENIRLVFKAGKVVEATASKNERFLNTMLDSDPGARVLGELGIGTNMKIQSFIKNILFDEKIGGTIHLAVGNSYPETGGTNTSTLHWDMIKDLRQGGEIHVDGHVFQKHGRFV